MVDLDSKLLSDKAPGTFAAEKVLGPYNLHNVRVKAFELHLDRIVLIETVILEADNGPGSLNGCSGLFDFIQENPLDLALMNERGERVPCVDEPRTTGPTSGSVNPLAVGKGIPERDVVDLCRVVRHDLALQAEISKNFGGARLNTVGTASCCGHRAIVNMFDLVSPSGHAEGQEQPNRACAHDDNVVFLLRVGHGGDESGK